MSRKQVSTAIDVASLRVGEGNAVPRAREEDPEPSNESAFTAAAGAKDAQLIAGLESDARQKKPQKRMYLASAEAEAATAAVKLRSREQDVRLKRTMSWVVIIAVGLQLIVADWFLIHTVALSGRTPPESVLVAWLSASVVEVLGIVAIVARNLFPDRGSRSRKRNR